MRMGMRYLQPRRLQGVLRITVQCKTRELKRGSPERVLISRGPLQGQLNSGNDDLTHVITTRCVIKGTTCLKSSCAGL